MARVMHGMHERQVMLYLLAILAGAAFGLCVPGAAAPLEHVIAPTLAALLFVTFLAVPFARIARVFADVRFLAALIVLNFVVVPVVVFGLSRLVAADSALLLGVLLVLLTPCVDYVIVFSGLAGGDRERLLAATPLLLIAQFALLPAFLWLMAGSEPATVIDARPFLEAFVGLIALPLSLAIVVQLVARRSASVRRAVPAAIAAGVPLMMLTLAVVVGAQIFRVQASLGSLIAVVPLFAAFAAALAGLGPLVARAFRLGRPARIAVVFSGVTRNSLVVLPLALALPPGLELAPLVVVTQTLVELLVLVALVALVRRGRR